MGDPLNDLDFESDYVPLRREFVKGLLGIATATAGLVEAFPGFDKLIGRALPSEELLDEILAAAEDDFGL